MQVEATIIVQIHQTDRPSPIGGGDSRQERRFLKITRSRIDQQGISRNLRHCCRAIRPFVEARPGIGHHTLVLLMGGRGHVGDDEVDQSVVVHVTVIRAHGGESRVRQHASGNVGKRSIPVVMVKGVRHAVVVGNVKIRPTVVIIVPPGCRMTAGVQSDARLVGDVQKCPVALIMEHIPSPPATGAFVRQHVRGDIHIEQPVAVVVAERRHHRGIDHVQAVGMGHLLEGAVALIDIEQIRSIITTDVDIQEAVVIHIGKGGAKLPNLRRVTLVPDAGLVRHVLELEVAEIAEKAA